MLMESHEVLESRPGRRAIGDVLHDVAHPPRGAYRDGLFPIELRIVPVQLRERHQLLGNASATRGVEPGTCVLERARNVESRVCREECNATPQVDDSFAVADLQPGPSKRWVRLR